MSAKGLILGFEVGTGKPVSIPLGHMCVTGQTQMSGKTTAIEAIAERSGLRALAFRTKRGERSFGVARVIPPYFRERTDWRFVESILESTMRQKMRFERAWIVRASKGARTLADVKTNVDRLIGESKRSMDRDIYMLLGEYLDIVVPLIGRLPAVKELTLGASGLHVMDLSSYPTELAALCIRSAMEWVYEEEKNVLVVVPEAWDFLPEGRGSPVKLAAVDLARKGAALGNYLIMDSQDLAGISKEIIRQATVWVMGVQREENEVKRSLAHIPLGVAKPKPKDITTLKLGQFWVCTPEFAVKIYVQPIWMKAPEAIEVALGKRPPRPRPSSASSIDAELVPYPARAVGGRDVAADVAELKSSHEELVHDVREAFKEIRGAIKDVGEIVMRMQAREQARSRIPLRPGGKLVEVELKAGSKFDVEDGPCFDGGCDHDGEHKPVRVVDEAMLNVPIRKIDASPDTVKLYEKIVNKGRAVAARMTQKGWDPVEEEQYQKWKARLVGELRQEAPLLLKILATSPELEIEIEREVMPIDGKSLRGRVGRLILDGFFDDYQSAAAAVKRLDEIGAAVDRSNARREVEWMLEHGFLYKNTNGYKAVSGAKGVKVRAKG